MRFEEHPLFEELAQEHIKELADQSEIRRFRGGDLIFDERTPSESLYLVLDGTVVFKKKVAAKDFRTVSHCHQGEFFGEIGLFTGDPRSTRAEASDSCELAKIPRESFLQFIKKHPEPIERILRSIIQHLHETTDHYVKDMLRQEKMAVVGSMVNTIIHDFKNPFTLINLAAEIIAKMHPDDSTQQLCRTILEQVERMGGMAEELHTFSRGKQQFNFAPIRLPALMERFQEHNLPYFEKDNLTITLDVADVAFEGEEAKLLRVLQNLVGNAIEALNGRPGEIHIYGGKEKDNALIVVRDTAGGIPEKIRGHFFEPFVTFGKSQGTGLGTAIIKSIVDAHSGSITFDTEQGVGTTFYVRLPLKQPAQVVNHRLNSPDGSTGYQP
jgi:signal transduction histidine kinase